MSQRSVGVDANIRAQSMRSCSSNSLNFASRFSSLAYFFSSIRLFHAFEFRREACRRNRYLSEKV